jgi:hypothetical protein
MIYLVDPSEVKGVCTLFCKSVAYPMYGVPKCLDVLY